jgi:anti-anti-sigma regulatory factor
MLRIIEEEDGRSLTFKLAGKLAGAWTPELERCWRSAISTRQPDAVSIDLAEVTFVDEAGKQLLTRMARSGVALIAADMVMKALVEQIAQRLTGRRIEKKRSK